MSKEIRWLWKESRQWEEKGLISSQQAEQIRRLYPEPGTPLPWSTIVFSGLGAIIAGLGIVLLIAYNWHSLHKFAKLGMIFAGIAALHTVGLRLFLRSARWRELGEAISLLGSMLFGAGIWLVAQVYHIEEHYPNGFLLWGLGALALAWAMPSLAQGLLAVTVLCIWGCSEGWGFDRAVHWAPVMVLAGTGLLAWRLQSRLLLFATLAAISLLTCATVSAVQSGLLLRVALDCSLAFVAVSILTRRWGWFPEGANIWAVFGWFGFLLCVYLLTFPGIVEDLLGWRSRASIEPTPTFILYEWGPLGVCLALWGMVAWPLRPGNSGEGRPRDCQMEEWLLPLTAIVCQIMAVSRFSEDTWTMAGVFNLVFLAVAGAWMARGCRKGLLNPLLLGAGLLVVLTTARYFDLFESLAVRGMVFVMVGALFFAEGALFRRSNRRTATGGTV